MAVYFARAETTSLVKIGFAVSVERRMNHLQAGCPYRLTVARVVEGDRLLEAAFHALFAEYRLEREWFNWVPEMQTALAVVRGRNPAILASQGSFSELVEELGGPTQLAHKMGLPHQQVAKFRQRNRIPAWHWPTLQSLGVPADRLIACEIARAAETEAA